MKTVNFSEIDKSNAFYPLITIFFLSFHGILEFSCRKLIVDLKSYSKSENDFYESIDEIPINLPIHLKEELKKFKAFTPMIFSIEANKKMSADSYYFDLEKSLSQFESIEEVTKNINILANILIIASYEVLFEKNPRSNEVLEFFRHVRNAAAHNGKFHFTDKVIDKNKNELKKIAKWNKFEVKLNLQGYKLFNVNKTNNNNFWEYVDLIEFLLDIENHFPELKHNK